MGRPKFKFRLREPPQKKKKKKSKLGLQVVLERKNHTTLVERY
jgi:hypothetical protein